MTTAAIKAIKVAKALAAATTPKGHGDVVELFGKTYVWSHDARTGAPAFHLDRDPFAEERHELMEALAANRARYLAAEIPPPRAG